MGLTIYANGDEYHFDMSYGGFFYLRTHIATLLNEEFGKTYKSLVGYHTYEEYESIDKYLNEIASDENLDADIIDFLNMSDCSGKLNYRVCKKVYELIKDTHIDDRMCCYNYNEYDKYYAHGDKAFDAFKDFLNRCYSKHRYMRWY